MYNLTKQLQTLEKVQSAFVFGNHCFDFYYVRVLNSNVYLFIMLSFFWKSSKC